MQIKADYQLKNIAGDYVVVSSGGSVMDLTSSFSLNETAVLLWKTLEKGCEEKDLVAALTKEYQVDESQAAADVKSFIEYLSSREMLE